MAVARQNLPDLMRGDSRRFEMTFLDQAGQPINIANTDIWFTLKIARNDPDPGVLQKTVTFPDDANSQAGLGYLKLEPAETELLEPGTKYWYDFQWVRSGSQDVDTVGWGQIKVVQDVTQDTV